MDQDWQYGMHMGGDELLASDVGHLDDVEYPVAVSRSLWREKWVTVQEERAAAVKLFVNAADQGLLAHCISTFVRKLKYEVRHCTHQNRVHARRRVPRRAHRSAAKAVLVLCEGMGRAAGRQGRPCVAKPLKATSTCRRACHRRSRARIATDHSRRVSGQSGMNAATRQHPSKTSPGPPRDPKTGS